MPEEAEEPGLGGGDAELHDGGGGGGDCVEDPQEGVPGDDGCQEAPALKWKVQARDMPLGM